MKSSSFSNKWSEIYEFAWRNLKDSQNFIEKAGHIDEPLATLDNEGSNQQNSEGIVIIEEVKI